MSYISILDYGLGNPGSIKNMLDHLDIKSEIINSDKRLEKSDSIILPGVGKFDKAIELLKKKNFFYQLKNLIKEKQIPTLGICLGMQLLFDESEEGKEKGLKVLKGSFKKIPYLKNNPVPHMGWNYSNYINKNFIISQDKLLKERYYFVHSYWLKEINPKNILCYTNYSDKFISGVIKDNIIGVQFHPEKSHSYGFRFFQSFASYYSIG